MLMRLYPIDKSVVFYKEKEGRHVRIINKPKVHLYQAMVTVTDFV
jgi:hypothetical protein